MNKDFKDGEKYLNSILFIIILFSLYHLLIFFNESLVKENIERNSIILGVSLIVFLLYHGINRNSKRVLLVILSLILLIIPLTYNFEYNNSDSTVVEVHFHLTNSENIIFMELWQDLIYNNGDLDSHTNITFEKTKSNSTNVSISYSPDCNFESFNLWFDGLRISNLSCDNMNCEIKQKGRYTINSRCFIKNQEPYGRIEIRATSFDRNPVFQEMFSRIHFSRLIYECSDSCIILLKGSQYSPLDPRISGSGWIMFREGFEIKNVNSSTLDYKIFTNRKLPMFIRNFLYPFFLSVLLILITKSIERDKKFKHE